jgi:hypothetical protein
MQSVGTVNPVGYTGYMVERDNMNNTRSTKSQIAARVAAGQDSEVFSHETLGHFDISKLRAAILGAPNFKPDRFFFSALKFYDGESMDNPWKRLFDARDIDLARVNELTPEQIADPVIHLVVPPRLADNSPVTTHLLVDGIHRLYRRRQDRKPDYWSYVLPIDWAPRVPAWAIELSGLIDPSSQWGNKEMVDGKIVDIRKEE